MCGLVGYLGQKPAVPLITECLRRLEYRGYDSAGIAIQENGHIEVRKTPGKIKDLVQILDHLPLFGYQGIAHTRWATHGAPDKLENAHPHYCGSVAVVHNGIIENYRKLKEFLITKGCIFVSDTDTEVVPQLINHHLTQGLDPVEATKTAIRMLEGSFALVIMFEGYEDFLMAARENSPLTIGFGTDGAFIGSDILQFLGVAERYICLENGDIARITKMGTEIWDRSGKAAKRAIRPVVAAHHEIGKEGFRDFMRKEIGEQPVVVAETVRSLMDPARHRILLPKLPFDFRAVSTLLMVGCGTAGYAGLVGQYWFERLTGLPVAWAIGSEFRYREVPIHGHEAGIFISQSGETADTRAAMEYVQTHACPALAIVNVRESQMAQLADGILHTRAGPEIGVASTKAFTTQLAALICLAIGAAKMRGTITDELEAEFSEALDRLPIHIEAVIALEDTLKEIGNRLAAAEHVFYIGRGLSYPIALEGALKLKEISYVHAEAFAAGELKHGPLALIKEGTPVVGIAPFDQLFGKTTSNLKEVEARGARIFLLSDTEGCKRLAHEPWTTVALPKTHALLSPFTTTVACQLIAYHAALCNGTDVDQPRNLAKSVTVE